MKQEVTRDVVSDLWPLYRAGEASSDSRRLVDDFLAQDRTFARMLNESNGLQGAMPALRLSPEAERDLLDNARERARLKLLVIAGGIALGGIILLAALVGAFLLASHDLGLG